MRGCEAVILDRDGVINRDRPDCVHGLDEFELIPGSVAAIARLSARFPAPPLATNQSCIGRGWVPREVVEGIHGWLAERVREAGGALGPVFLCPHAPDAGCACRKPKTALLEAACEALGVAPAAALFVGDSLKDAQAAAALGMGFCLVRTGKGAQTHAAAPELEVCDDLTALAERLGC